LKLGWVVGRFGKVRLFAFIIPTGLTEFQFQYLSVRYLSEESIF